MDIIHKNGSWFFFFYELFLTFISFLPVNKINLTIIKKNPSILQRDKVWFIKSSVLLHDHLRCALGKGKERKKRDKSLVRECN